MKKKILSLAVAAGLAGAVAGTAQAGMHVNDKGLGEALIFPFFSAEGGNATNIHLVNTTGLTKAVKVRFIEGMNSEEVLDFNLYLSPEDHWSGTIAHVQGEGREGSDNAVLLTADNSCTVPALGQARNLSTAAQNKYSVTDADVDGWTIPSDLTDVEAGERIVRFQPFTNFKYVDNGDSTRLDRTREGYVEIIEMGTLDPAVGLGLAAVHDANGEPNNCDALVAAWAVAPTAGTWAADATAEFLTDSTTPTLEKGGLYGYATVLNVTDGTAFGVDAVAIESLTDDTVFQLNAAPGNTQPSLAQGQLVSTVFDGQTATDTLFESGIDAVSSLFMVDTMSHDFVVDPALNASTDWVITMPTKRFYVNPTVVEGEEPIIGNPFTSGWSEAAKACEPVAMAHWDREEAYVAPPSIGAGFSPAPTTEEESIDANLCTEVSILDFSAQGGIHGSDRITYGFTPEYTEGWARLSFRGTDLNDPSAIGADSSPEFGNRVLTGLSGLTFQGLPAVGVAVQKFVNDENEAGVIINYASSSVLKRTTDNVVAP